ncbi:hypothetical protein OXX69_013040, partial [Metschnikowia pulcherrima]
MEYDKVRYDRLNQVVKKGRGTYDKNAVDAGSGAKMLPGYKQHGRWRRRTRNRSETNPKVLPR